MRLGLTRIPFLAVVSLGCATLRPELPVAIPKSPAPEQARCQVAARQDTPLVTEWPAAEKANLEVLLQRGAVAVAYSGCRMRVLTGCNLQGGYLWQRTSPMRDAFEVNDESSLYARLPLGAASLEGDLKLAGKLAVETQVSGQLRLQGLQPGDIPPEGECVQATHVIGALSVGAFSISRGGSTTVGAGAGVQVVSAGGSVTHGVSVIRAAGDAQACGLATDQAPHPNCRSPIQVFLWGIPGRGGVEEGPPGMVRVDLLSGDPEARWDVYIDDRAACTTPCTQWVDPARPISLRTREDNRSGRPDKVSVPHLGPYAAGGPMQLRAHPTADGMMSTGIVFTSLGGFGVMMGGMLSLLGCHDADRPGLCTGGLVTMGAGAAVAAGSVSLILLALPRAEVLPLYRSLDGATTIQAGPGYVSGTF